MHKNKFWLVFLIFVIVVTLGNVSLAAYRYFNYRQLQAQAPLLKFTTEINEISDTYYFVDVNYTFEANGHTFSGNSFSTERHFLNHYAAEDEEKAFNAHPPKVWYDPTNPEHSSLVKKFPLRDIGASLALIGLLIYFIWLGYRVGAISPRL